MPTARVCPCVLGLLLSGLLTGCELPEAEVGFAQPFPANAPDLRAFPARWQGQYVAAGDTSQHLLIGRRQLVSRRFLSLTVAARQLDSMNLSQRAAWGRGPDGTGYQMQAVGADSVRLRWEERDTLAALGPRTKLRRYRNRYYLSTKDPADSTAWTVQRLAVADRQLLRQSFNPDTLRIRALDPATVQLRRNPGNLYFTLDPRPGRATRQVDGYDGL